MKCRFCTNNLSHVFVDLNSSPPSNSYLTIDQLTKNEATYPLKIFVCEKCFLVQIDEYAKHDDIFDDNYAYFSSYSSSWLNHAREYVEKMISEFGFNQNSRIVEVASNDGYLLQYFKNKNIPVTGIEPTANTATVAREKGIPTIVEFFGTSLAEKLKKENGGADLLLGNNVLAHVPDINDFIKGLAVLLNEDGIITMEFPHLVQLIENNQFDTIYHEHFSYLSFTTVNQIFEEFQLKIFHVEELPTHGGSLRIYAKHLNSKKNPERGSVKELLSREEKKGIKDISYYHGFDAKVKKIKKNLLDFLNNARNNQKKVAGYGAAAKGNTLLNFCGIHSDLISFISDASPHKQGKFMPGSHIPIKDEDYLKQQKPDYVLILPWNLQPEIMAQLNYINEWNGRFVVAIPNLSIL